MSFPKPTGVTSATSNRYATVWGRRLERAGIRHPDVRGIAIAICVIDDLIESKPTIAPRTFRHYKAAVLHVLVSLTKRPSVADRIPPDLLSAIDRLAATSSDGCMRNSQRTSARKAKRLPSRDTDAIEQYIQKQGQQSDLALPALSAMAVLRLTGARPCELLGLKVHCSAPGTLDVTIRNAKTTNGRGLGEERTLCFRDLTDAETSALLNWPDTLKAFTTKCTPAAAITRIGKYFSRAARRTLRKRSKYPCLYTFRHQFAADAKAAGLSPEEIAALMGHASDVTATRNYGRRVSGQGGIKAHASPSAVSKVRRKAKTFLPSNFAEGPRSGP